MMGATSPSQETFQSFKVLSGDGCQRLDTYLSWLQQHIQREPFCDGHWDSTKAVIDKFVAPRKADIGDVLDVGTNGYAYELFFEQGITWVGVTLGPDYFFCKEKQLRVFRFDMNLMPFQDDSFDMVFARHTIEHSVMPLVALLEWRRIAKKYILIVTPRPPHFERFPNHYSIMSQQMWEWLFENALLEIVDQDHKTDSIELRWLLKV